MLSCWGSVLYWRYRSLPKYFLPSRVGRSELWSTLGFVSLCTVFSELTVDLCFGVVGIVGSGESTVFSDRSGLGSCVCLSVPQLTGHLKFQLFYLEGFLIENQVLLVVDFGFEHFCEVYFLCQNKILYGLNLVLTSLWD